MPAILLHGHSIAKIRQKQAPIQIVGTQHCVQMIDTTKWLLYKYIGIKCRNDSTIKTYFSIQHQHRNKRCFPPTITHTPELAQQWPSRPCLLGQKAERKRTKINTTHYGKKSAHDYNNFDLNQPTSHFLLLPPINIEK